MWQTFTSKGQYKDSPPERTGDAEYWADDAPPHRLQVIARLPAEFSARTPATLLQLLALFVPASGLALLAIEEPAAVASLIYWGLWTLFMANALMRLGASLVPLRPSTVAPRGSEAGPLPFYTVIVALYDEAAIVPQLVTAMSRLNYPHERMEVLFALEISDRATIDAFAAHGMPAHMRVIEVPAGTPMTKPRALNYALERARGQLVVIYDAEDQPHPDQLRAAVDTFMRCGRKLACLQAPLRPIGAKGFIGRQFAAEYAVQFEVFLPALASAGLPFPLGGTSNHFRTDVLRKVGGWDAHNVTEDADLGLRLAQYGYESGLISPPTFETPPSTTGVWIPQRTRWIKGYIQTLFVHSRINTGRWRVWLSMVAGVGLSAGAALAYAPFTALALMVLVINAVQFLGNPTKGLPPLQPADAVLIVFANLAALTALWRGARRANTRFGVLDLLCAPAYWCLQSVAAFFAIYKFLVEPFHWDKTPHAPADPVHNPLAGEAATAYADLHDRSFRTDNPAHPAVD